MAQKPTPAMDLEEFRRRGHEMVDFMADYYKRIESFSVQAQVEPGYLKSLLPDAAPAQGESWESIMEDVNTKIMPGVTHWLSPNFFAYFPAQTSFPSILADMLCSTLNVVGFNWVCSPACTELETIVLDWLAKALQLPEDFLSKGKGGGVIQGTASEAVVVSVLAGKSKALSKLKTLHGDSYSEQQLHSDTASLVAYCSDQAHSCIKKAFMVAGFAPSQLRVLTTYREDDFSMRPAALQAAMEEDVKAGKVPFFVAATVGTTSTLAVDPISELGPIARTHDVWFHIDAAYAGSACLLPEYRHLINGVEFADAFNFNPHKWMFVGFDCSAYFIKNRSYLLDALSITPEYLRNKASESGEVIDYRDWQIPLGRRFRSLKLWFTLRSYGIEKIQEEIRYHCQLANYFEKLVRSDSRFELVTPKSLTLVCFRVNVGETEEKKNELSKKLLEAVNATTKIFFVHTIVGGIYTLRIPCGAANQTTRHLDQAWTVIVQETDKLLNGADA
eukprot:GILK01005374.1.p1 GENE.GILK01005374.1~~GILK01005374.1.p1  ORF type:complete len:525 (+),score=96.26 GILK01005374.1:70-1575(+)